MTGEDQQWPFFSPGRPEIVDVAKAHRLDMEAGCREACRHNSLTPRVIGRDRGAADELTRQRQRGIDVVSCWHAASR